MTIVRSVKGTVQGANYYSSVANVAAPVGALTLRIPAGTASFAPTASSGVIRVKLNNAPTGTSQITSITGTDGTTTVKLYTGDTAAVTAGQVEDLMWDFISDLNLTSITILATMAVAAGTADAEVVYSS